MKFLTCSGKSTKKAKIKKAPRYVHITECLHSVNGSYPGAARSTYYLSNSLSDAVQSYKSPELGKFELDIFIPSLKIAVT